MDIEITFINQSSDGHNYDVVVLQKNVATHFDETAVAWIVINNVGRGWTRKFLYPVNFYVGAQDSWGNVGNLQQAINGQKWNVVRSTSGNILTLDASGASSRNAVEIKNCLPSGSVDAQIYKDGKLLAIKTGVSPQQKAVFEFKPTIWVGVVREIEEGDIMNTAILADINTEISLVGITRANLIMTGGGATPIKFILVPTA
jgi:hypothetical protein